VGAFQKAECLPGHITTQNFTSAHAPSGHFYFSKCSHLIVFSLCQWGGYNGKINFKIKIGPGFYAQIHVQQRIWSLLL
jgi:hypothetical protein